MAAAMWRQADHSAATRDSDLQYSDRLAEPTSSSGESHHETPTRTLRSPDRGGGVGADDGMAVGIDGGGYVTTGGSFSGNAGSGSTIFGSAGGTDIFLWRIAP